MVNIFRNNGLLEIGDRLSELQQIAEIDLKCQSVNPGSAETMFTFFNQGRGVARPVIGLSNRGMLEARWDSENQMLNIMATFRPDNCVWYAVLDHSAEDYRHDEVSVAKMMDIVSAHGFMA